MQSETNGTGVEIPDSPATVKVRPFVFIFTYINFFTRMKRPFLIYNSLLLQSSIFGATALISACFPAIAIPHTEYIAQKNQNQSYDTLSTSLPEIEVLSETDSKNLSSSTPLHIIDTQAISEAGITDFSDALKRIPGINLRDYGGAGGLKTVSVRGLGAQHTGIIYDGIPLSDLRNGEIDLSRFSLNNLSTIALSALDSDDIFLPARASASASSVYVSSIRSSGYNSRRLNLKAKMKVGSFSQYNPYIFAQYTSGEKFAFNAMAEFIHAKNDYPFSYRNGKYEMTEKRKNSRMNSVNSEINIYYTPDLGHTLSVKIYYYENSRLLPGPVIYYVKDSNERLFDRNTFIQTHYVSKLSSLLSLKLIGKYSYSFTNYVDVDGIYPGGRLDQDYTQNEGYASASLLITPWENITFNYAADWILNTLSSNLKTDRNPRRNSVLQAITAQYKTSRISAKARLLYTLTSDRTQTASGVGEEIGKVKKNFDRFSPSVSVSVRPIEVWPLHIRLAYKNIFRLPTFNELYFDNYGTVSLKPEITDQINLGITYSLPSGSYVKDFSVIADGYCNFVKDKIVAIPYNLFKWTMTNLGKTRVYGVDLSIRTEVFVAPRHSFVLTGSYSYQRAEIRTSPDMLDWKKQVAYTPLNSGSASISWQNPWVAPTINLIASSARFTTNANLPSTRMAGYAEIGVSIQRSFTFRKNLELELRGDFRNILNKQYCIIARYPMPGRSWSISAAFTV